MIEIKHRVVLQHIDTGMFVSQSADNFPLTPKIGQARKFLNEDQINLWLQASSYAPEDPEEYQVVKISITFRLEDTESD